MHKKTGLIAIAAASAALGLGACGSSNTSSSASTSDPAAAVPASVPMYFSVTVRPDSSETSTLKTIVNNFGGAGTWSKLITKADAGLSKQIGSISQINSVLGQRIGIAFTSIPTSSELNGSNTPSSFLFVIPTTNPSKALSLVQNSLKSSHDGTQAATKGNYVLVGGASAIAAAKSATSTLASSAGYQNLGSTNSSTVGTGFIALKPLITDLEADPALASLLKNSSYAKSLSNLPADASVGMALQASPSAIALDVKPFDIPKSATSSAVSSSVAGLPADSIIALSLNFSKASFESISKSFSAGFMQGLDSGISSSGLSGGLGEAQALGTKVLGEIQTTILPALGPLQLSFGGSSITSLHAGLSIASFDPAAGARVLKLLYSEIEKKGTVQATKTANGFTIQIPPIFNVNVSQSAGKIIALLGYTNASQFLSPSAKLSSNSTYTSAVSQLPSGAHVPFFLNFGPLETLIKAVGPAAGSTTNLGKVERVLNHLNYVILGGSSGETRFVVGLK